jgi:hypothetical protein
MSDDALGRLKREMTAVMRRQSPQETSEPETDDDAPPR